MARLKFCTLFLFAFTRCIVFAFEVEIQQIDISGFPSIDIYLNIPFELRSELTDHPSEKIQVFENQDTLQIEDISIGKKVVLPRHFIFLIDLSSSMKGEPIRSVQKNLILLVDSLREHDQAAVVTFCGGVNYLLELTKDKNKIYHAISTLKIGKGGTPVYDGIIRSLDILKTADISDRKMVILLSDGQDTKSKMGFNKALKVASDSKIPVYTIGFVSKDTWRQSNDTAQARLEKISKASEGEYLSAENIERFISTFKQLEERAYGEVCIRVRSMQKQKIIEKNKHIQIQLFQYKIEKEYVLDANVIKRFNDDLREKETARYKRILIIACSILGFILILRLFIFRLRNKPDRSFKRELNNTLQQVEKAIAPSLELGCKRFIGDLTLSDIPQFSPLKLEQMLLSVKASENNPYSPWLLKVDLQKEEAIYMANLLLAYSKKLDPAWYPQILAQLNTLSRQIDENIDYGSEKLNDISYWENWWGKAKSNEEKQKIVREAERFKKNMVKQADNIRLKGKREIKDRIENVVKDIQYKKGKEVIFFTKGIKDEPVHIRGEILEASVDQIKFKTSTVLTIENVLCPGPVLVILTQFKNMIKSELLAQMGVLYIVGDIKILMDRSYEITVQRTKQLDTIDKKATEDLMDILWSKAI